MAPPPVLEEDTSVGRAGERTARFLPVLMFELPRYLTLTACGSRRAPYPNSPFPPLCVSPREQLDRVELS